MSGLLKHCKLKEIPTVFWNKEDPPHYERFAPVASMFDLVITSDIDMLTRYRKDYNISAIALPFAAEPKIHNPRPQTRRLNKAVFAGSYYRDKPKRCEDFNSLMQCIEMSGLEYDIYDRNYSSDLEKFAFPEHFQKSIVGTLQPHEIYKAHKGYKYQLNINTVQSSATMFARRVFESLACGTPVISNDSVGMNILFEDIPIVVNTEAPDRLKDLESSYTLYTDLARRGVRKVMNEHTYSHRLKTICDRLGINIEVETPEAVLSIIATNDQDIVIAKSIFNRQTASNKRLFIELENFDNSYQYLNQCDGNTTFALRGAKDLYDKKETYYGSGNVFHHDLIAPLEATDLEDFLYWGHLGTSSFPFEVNELGDSHND